MIFYDLRMYNKCVRVCRFRFVLFSLRRKRERRRTRKKSTYDRDVNNVMTIVKRVCVAEIIWKREKQNRRAEDARERRRACLVKRTQFSSGPRCVSFAHESCVSNRIKSKRLQQIRVSFRKICNRSNTNDFIDFYFFFLIVFSIDSIRYEPHTSNVE